MFQSSTLKVPRGIFNPERKTCWLASCVQVLVDIPQFRSALLDRTDFSGFPERSRRKDLPYLYQEFVRSLREIFKKLGNDATYPLAIEDLLKAGNAVAKRSKNQKCFHMGRQEDAGEHLQYILQYVENANYQSALDCFRITANGGSSLVTVELNCTLGNFHAAFHQALCHANHIDQSPLIDRSPDVFIFVLNRGDASGRKWTNPFNFEEEFYLDKYLSAAEAEVRRLYDRNQYRNWHNDETRYCFSEEGEKAQSFDLGLCCKFKKGYHRIRKGPYKEWKYEKGKMLPYTLRSVIIHEGDLLAGHYYVYRRRPNLSEPGSGKLSGPIHSTVSSKASLWYEINDTRVELGPSEFMLNAARVNGTVLVFGRKEYKDTDKWAVREKEDMPSTNMNDYKYEGLTSKLASFSFMGTPESNDDEEEEDYQSRPPISDDFMNGRDEDAGENEPEETPEDFPRYRVYAPENSPVRDLSPEYSSGMDEAYASYDDDDDEPSPTIAEPSPYYKIPYQQSSKTNSSMSTAASSSAGRQTTFSAPSNAQLRSEKSGQFVMPPPSSKSIQQKSILRTHSSAAPKATPPPPTRQPMREVYTSSLRKEKRAAPGSPIAPAPVLRQPMRPLHSPQKNNGHRRDASERPMPTPPRTEQRQFEPRALPKQPLAARSQWPPSTDFTTDSHWEDYSYTNEMPADPPFKRPRLDHAPSSTNFMGAQHERPERYRFRPFPDAFKHKTTIPAADSLQLAPCANVAWEKAAERFKMEKELKAATAAAEEKRKVEEKALRKQSRQTKNPFSDEQIVRQKRNKEILFIQDALYPDDDDDDDDAAPEPSVFLLIRPENANDKLHREKLDAFFNEAIDDDDALLHPEDEDLKKKTSEYQELMRLTYSREDKTRLADSDARWEQLEWLLKPTKKRRDEWRREEEQRQLQQLRRNIALPALLRTCDIGLCAKQLLHKSEKEIVEVIRNYIDDVYSVGWSMDKITCRMSAVLFSTYVDDGNVCEFGLAYAILRALILKNYDEDEAEVARINNILYGICKKRIKSGRPSYKFLLTRFDLFLSAVERYNTLLVLWTKSLGTWDALTAKVHRMDSVVLDLTESLQLVIPALHCLSSLLALLDEGCSVARLMECLDIPPLLFSKMIGVLFRLTLIQLFRLALIYKRASKSTGRLAEARRLGRRAMYHLHSFKKELEKWRDGIKSSNVEIIVEDYGSKEIDEALLAADNFLVVFLARFGVADANEEAEFALDRMAYKDHWRTSALSALEEPKLTKEYEETVAGILSHKNFNDILHRLTFSYVHNVPEQCMSLTPQFRDRKY